MAKHKTNRQVLAKAIKEMDDVHLAFVRDMMLQSSEGILAQKEQIRESMKNSFIHPDLYLAAIQDLHDRIKLED